MSPLLRRLVSVFQTYGGVLCSRSYFALWLGQLLSGFGGTLHYIALVVLVFWLTGHGLPVAGLVAAEMVPVTWSGSNAMWAGVSWPSPPATSPPLKCSGSAEPPRLGIAMPDASGP